MKYVFTYPAAEVPAIGKVTILANDESVIAIRLGEPDIDLKDATVRETPLIRQACTELREYFAGKRKDFTFSCLQPGTPFQQQVWAALRDIPYGETRSYKQIAQAIGKPGAARAVGMANNRNRLPIVIPCHRVIGSDGKLVGYAGGIAIKETLLKLEQKHV